MNIIDHFNHLTLTSDQEKALRKIESFLAGKQKVFLLKGYAGTGKTTLLQGITEFLSAQNINSRLMAPTGRAAMVLSKKTGKGASTIHRGIYNMDELEEKEEGNSFKFFYKLKVNEDSSSCVYIVDEASMVSDFYSDDEFFMFGSGHLLKDLASFAFSTEPNRKVIFIGDDAQLPPVNMNFSPALDTTYIEKKYNLTVEETTLTEVVRQKEGSGILKSATLLREALTSNTFNQFALQYDQGDIQNIPPEAFLDSYAQIAKKTGVAETIVITHSNRQALDFNLQIRGLRYHEPKDIVQKEDLLIITKNNYNREVELFNGMFARVVEAGGISYSSKPRFKVKGGATVERELIFRDVLVEVEDVSGSLHQLKTTLLDQFLTVKEGRLHPYDQIALYIDFKNRMQERGIKPKTETFRNALKKDLYFNALQAKYGYAITCHKSQGGEWKSVIIDFKVYMGKLTPAFFRWAYTAITRASNQLYSIDAPKYNAMSNYVISDIEGIKRVLKGTFYVPVSENNPLFFLEHRMNELKELSQEQGIELSFTTHNNQVKTTFLRGAENALVQLWYNNTGFTTTTYVNTSSEEFSAIIQQLLISSLLPTEVPFQAKFPFQEELHDYILDLLQEEDIPLTNIVQNDWNDQYFIYTGADCAMVEFYFNGKHMYTKANPKSTLGSDDKKLLALVARLRGQ